MRACRILLASRIDPGAVEYLSDRHDVRSAINASGDELRAAVGDREILIFRSGVEISTDVIGAAPDLRLLLRAGSGLDNVDLTYAASRGVRLIRVPGPGAQSVAELTFALMLALARQLLVADRGMRDGRWLKAELTGYLLKGKTLGVIGLGNIGTRVAEMGVAWGMRAIGCVEHPSPERAATFRDRGVELVDCETVLAEADFVSVHVPLKPENHHLLDAAALAGMKRGAFLVNIARGGVVDEAALGRELSDGGHLAGAALDVHEREGDGPPSPLARLSNVVLTPHIGAATVDSQREIGREVIRIVESYAAASPAEMSQASMGA